MRNLSRISLAIAASGALVGSIALPASAAPLTDTTDTTVTVSAGELSIAAPATAELPAVDPGATTTIALGDVVVTDLRAGTAGWSASVSISAFTTAADVVPAGTIPASAGSYTTATATLGGAGTATFAGTPSSNLSTPTVVQEASAVSGNHTATWGADLNLAAPADALAGVYTATLTHSLI